MDNTAQRLTEAQANVIHRAGFGTYRPMGDAPTARADALVAAGFLAVNPSTGIYFQTEKGYRALNA